MGRSSKSATFFEHLDELRGYAVKSIAAVVLASCVTYFFTDPILAFLVKPAGKLFFLSPADAFLAHLGLALWLGFFLALPFVIYQVWLFFSSGLKENEQRYVLIFTPLSILTFFIGGCFAYFIMVPIALKFLLGFSSEYMVPMITVGNYVSFVGTLILAFGVLFELPLILMFLTKIGIATPEFLIQKRRVAIIAILILSAVITPPDCITQVIMAGPLVVLYEIGIFASKLVYSRAGQLS